MPTLRTPLRFAVPIATLLTAGALVRASADSLPAALTPAAFWTLVESFSEPGGQFQSENFLSNENGLQGVIPALQQAVSPGGVYVGVGPEQNFTYIASLRPKMAFVIDIRRQNMVEHLVYKALFDLSANRADFLARLFSRTRPSGLTDAATVDDLLRAYGTAPVDEGAFTSNLEAVRKRLVDDWRLGLTEEDRAGVTRVMTVFKDFGPALNYNSRPGVVPAPGRGNATMPTYADVMMAADMAGRQWGYLVNEANYRLVRDMEARNLIVPITGDFGGPKAIRAVGKYLSDHQATVSVFYVSNVEQYLFQGADSRGNLNGGGTNFFANVATMPTDDKSVFVRSSNAGGRGTNAGRGFVGAVGRSNVFASIRETLAAVKDGRIKTYNDLFSFSR